MDTYKLLLVDGTAKYLTTSTASGDLSNTEVANLACDAGLIKYPSEVVDTEHWPAFDINDTVAASFVMRGSFEVPRAAEPITVANGDVVGFTYPDGKTYKIQVIIEECDPNGEEPRDLNSCELEDLGILGFGDIERNIHVEEG